MYWSGLHWILSKNFCRSQEFSLCKTLSLPVLYDENFSHLHFPGHPALPPNSGRYLGSVWHSPPCAIPWKLFSGSKLGNQRAHLNFSLSLKDHCPSLPGIQSFECCCFIYFVCFFQLFEENVNLTPLIQSWMEVEVPLVDFFFFSNLATSLTYWCKPYLVMIHHSFYLLLDWVC